MSCEIAFVDCRIAFWCVTGLLLIETLFLGIAIGAYGEQKGPDDDE